MISRGDLKHHDSSLFEAFLRWFGCIGNTIDIDSNLAEDFQTIEDLQTKELY